MAILDFEPGMTLQDRNALAPILKKTKNPKQSVQELQNELPPPFSFLHFYKEKNPNNAECLKTIIP